MGTIIPETIGSDKNLFENNQTLTNIKEDPINCFQTKYGEVEKTNTDSSLNENVNIESSLNLEGQVQHPTLTKIKDNQPTFSNKQVLSKENLQIHAPSLQHVPDRKKYYPHPSEGVTQENTSSLDSVKDGPTSDPSLDPVPDRKQYLANPPGGVAYTHTIQATSLDFVQDRMEYSNSQSVADTHWATTRTDDICKKFNLYPEKLKTELKDVFQNVSPLIKLLAPKYKNILPSLDNLLKLALRVKKSLETNSIHFANKTVIFLTIIFFQITK